MWGGGRPRDYKQQGRKDTLVLNSNNRLQLHGRSEFIVHNQLFHYKNRDRILHLVQKLVVEAVEVGAARHVGMWCFKTSERRWQTAVEEKCTRT